MSQLLADGCLSARTAGLLALIETPEAMEGYLLRAQGQDDAKRRAQRCITAVQEASRLAAGRGAGWPDIARAGARRAGSPYPAAPARTPQQVKDGAGMKEIHRMREVVFRVLAERPGHLEAQAVGAAFSAGVTLPILITAPTLEELQHEAREALIEHLGPAHGTVRVRVRRDPSAAGSSIRPVVRPGALCR